MPLETDITIRSKLSGLVPARTIDISNSGISAILPIELAIGETVELDLKVPSRPARRLTAIVRSRSAFRHGFEFSYIQNSDELLSG